MAAKHRIRIFAYGSNLCLQRMQERVPQAMPVAAGSVDQRRFEFHKLGIDGSAKADAFRTGQDHDTVWGAVYELDPAGKNQLDRHESLGTGYDLEAVNVATADGRSLRAYLYAARPEAIRKGLLPFRWYRDLVIRGAEQHSLPPVYIARLAAQECLPDPDRERARHFQRLAKK